MHQHSQIADQVTQLRSDNTNQVKINLEMMTQIKQSSERLALLQERQDRAEESVKDRLQALEAAQTKSFETLQRMISEEKRHKTA